MKFTKQQKLIIKKIASGDIKDIPSFIRYLIFLNFIILIKKILKSG